MIQDTSKKSLKEIIIEKKLGTLQTTVLKAFYNSPNSTDKEISESSNIPINIITARRNELVKEGLLEESERRPCKVTGRTSISWRKPLSWNNRSAEQQNTMLSNSQMNKLLSQLVKANRFQKKRIITECEQLLGR